MKQIFLFIAGLTLTVSAHAANKKLSPLTFTSPNSAVITYTGRKGKLAPFTPNGKSNVDFIKLMLADPNSEISKARIEIEKENCDGVVSTSVESYIDLCGEIYHTDPTEVGSGHSGSTDAGKDYAFFLGFARQGSGLIRIPEYLVIFSENVSQELDEKYDPTGIATKTLSVEKVIKLN